MTLLSVVSLSCSLLLFSFFSFSFSSLPFSSSSPSICQFSSNPSPPLSSFPLISYPSNSPFVSESTQLNSAFLLDPTSTSTVEFLQFVVSFESNTLRLLPTTDSPCNVTVIMSGNAGNPSSPCTYSLPAPLTPQQYIEYVYLPNNFVLSSLISISINISYTDKNNTAQIYPYTYNMTSGQIYDDGVIAIAFSFIDGVVSFPNSQNPTFHQSLYSFHLVNNDGVVDGNNHTLSVTLPDSSMTRVLLLSEYAYNYPVGINTLALPHNTSSYSLSALYRYSYDDINRQHGIIYDNTPSNLFIGYTPFTYSISGYTQGEDGLQFVKHNTTLAIRGVWGDVMTRSYTVQYSWYMRPSNHNGQSAEMIYTVPITPLLPNTDYQYITIPDFDALYPLGPSGDMNRYPISSEGSNSLNIEFLCVGGQGCNPGENLPMNGLFITSYAWGDPSTPYNVPWKIILGAMVGGGVLILISAAVFVIWYRKREQSRKALAGLQLQNGNNTNSNVIGNPGQGQV